MTVLVILQVPVLGEDDREELFIEVECVPGVGEIVSLIHDREHRVFEVESREFRLLLPPGASYGRQDCVFINVVEQ